MFLKLLTSPYVERLRRRAISGLDVNLYMEDRFELDSRNVRENPDIEITPTIIFKLPDNNGFHDFENSKILFESLKQMNPTQATDYRIWTYLTHAMFWEYMAKRSPVKDQPEG